MKQTTFTAKYSVEKNRSISSYMSFEHAKLMRRWYFFTKSKNTEERGKLFDDFYNALISHMALEEGSLSPVFNKHLGIDKEVSQTTVLSQDHETISKLLNNLRDAIYSNDEAIIEYTQNHFIRALKKHHKKEEETNYPLFDTIISDNDWKKILKGEL